MRRKDTFCKASRFEKGKAQENGITHARPDRAGNVVGCCDCLYQYRINADTYQNQKRLKTKRKQRFQVILTHCDLSGTDK